MSLEEAIEMVLVGVCELVGAAQQSEAGPEQVRLERRGPLITGAALQLPAYQGEALGEPACDVGAVEHMASIGLIPAVSWLFANEWGLGGLQEGWNPPEVKGGPP